MLPVRKTEQLRCGRFSTPGGFYFTTWCTQPRRGGLEEPTTISKFREVVKQSACAGDFLLGCATVMPDHVHMLFQLGSRLSLVQVISKLKAQSSASIAPLRLPWQNNFYEHQLQRDDSLDDFALYIFLNPYRAKLISCDQRWPGWIAGDICRFEFEQHLRSGDLPWPEWLGYVQGIEERFDREH